MVRLLGLDGFLPGVVGQRLSYGALEQESKVEDILDTYLLCRLCDRVVMIPAQVRRKLDAGQGHIVGQVAVHFPVEPVGQIRAAQVEAGSQRGKGQVLLQMQVDIVHDIADDHRIAGGRVPRHPVTILLQHLDHKGLLLLLGGDFTGGEQIIVIKGIKVKGVHLGPLCILA